MDNLFFIESFKTAHLIDSFKFSTHNAHEKKVIGVESIMISCLDNQGISNKKCFGTINRLITPELSLNRLFEAAKDEHLSMIKT